MTDTGQHTGRPRESRVDHAIERAVRELLAEVGYAALTMDGVAARAGVGKAAIYRRHASKAEMVFAVLVHGMDLAPLPDTGSLLGDVEAVLADTFTRLTAPGVLALAPLFIGELMSNADLSARFRETLMAAELAEVMAVLDRAIARGELTTRPDPGTVHAILLGSVFAWLCMLRREPAPELIPRLARLVVGGIGAGIGDRKIVGGGT